MKEYKILRDTDSEITKKLNNWRHDFHIEMVGQPIMDNRMRWDEEHQQFVPWGTLVVMLMRERKGDWEEGQI